MKKTHKVAMLPTEKAINTGNNIFWYYPNSQVLYKDGFQQHLYIISDDEIKEGDWMLTEGNVVCQVLELGDVDGDKKIVATTDSLYFGEYNEKLKRATYGLPQIPESFIQAYIKAYNEGKPITEVDLEMDGDESPAWSGMWKYWPKTRSDNTVIVHQSKMYSRDEMEKAYREGFKDGLNKVHRASEWIEDNL